MPDAGMSRRIVLIGPPAAGKTSLGHALAEYLSEPFFDTDSLFVGRYGSIRTFFENHSEADFRQREQEIVAETLAQQGVISLGGGAILSPETYHDLQALKDQPGQYVLYLKISSKAVTNRLRTGSRPLSATVSAWDQLLITREPMYQQLASGIIDTSFRTTKKVFQDTLELLGL